MAVYNVVSVGNKGEVSGVGHLHVKYDVLCTVVLSTHLNCSAFVSLYQSDTVFSRCLDFVPAGDMLKVST